jgi:GDP-4-dehydro-6-deoxy-D-mannose reductase
MTVLVTGLSGFVGAHCAEQLPAVGLDLDGKPVDLRRREDVLAAVAAARPAHVLHLAAASSVADSFADPTQTYEINFLGTLNLLLALREHGFRGRFLYVGSGDCYGTVPPAEMPIVEDRPLRPRNPYAVSKTAAEALCYQWSQDAAFEIVMARPFNHIGPRQDTRFVVADLARQVAAISRGGREPELSVGDIDVTRDFTDVRDVVRAYALLLERGAHGTVYNVCSSTERSIRDILQLLCTAARISPKIRVRADRLRPAEQRRMCGSYRRLADAVGWQPAIPIEQSLADMLAYWNDMDQE